ncbi:MAG: hypothetical protein U1E27_00720, partial [Kiritimatiellia bacterium]|nr:hypothetical protein [Kiritimatiellia bacterium]
MLAILEPLAILQELDRHLMALRREESALPNQKQAVESRLREAEKNLELSRDLQKRNAADIHQAEVDIGSAKEKTEKLRRQQLEIKSNEQYRALQHEIAAELKKIREIEDRELDLMEKAEQAKAAVDTQKAVLAEIRSTIQDQLGQIEQRTVQIQAERALEEAKRAELAARADPALLSRYNRLLAHVGAHAIVPIEREA